MTTEATPGDLGSTEGLGLLLDEWADAACVRFVSRSSGQRTTDTVSRDDLLQLMRAAVAAERERCANFSEGAVLDEMRRLDANWNGYGQSRSAALATAFKALRRVIAGPNVRGNLDPTALEEA